MPTLGAPQTTDNISNIYSIKIKELKFVPCKKVGNPARRDETAQGTMVGCTKRVGVRYGYPTAQITCSTEGRGSACIPVALPRSVGQRDPA